jgi:hypothetical protein
MLSLFTASKSKLNKEIPYLHFFDSIFHHEDGDKTYLRNVNKLPEHAADIPEDSILLLEDYF